MSVSEDILIVRDAIAGLDRIGAWPPGRAPAPDEILAPHEHRNALDPDRTIVVGNRGVGKTFWSEALVDPAARQHVATLYPRLGLDRLDAQLGFSSGYATEVAASERAISEAESVCQDPARIWEAVLLRSQAARIRIDVGQDLRDIAGWLQNNGEQGERALRAADNAVGVEGKRFLLVFDGLDTLGDNWEVIRRRLSGLIRFARLARSLRYIRLKIFLRLDQAEDWNLWRTPDASKLYNERVRLSWDQEALYDLLYFHLQREEEARDALARLAPEIHALHPQRRFFDAAATQRSVFSALAGPFMGGGSNRGNTYNWVVNHLADAHGETTPRAFLVALAYAAKRPARETVIDHLGIEAGVREASQRRLEELEEDYWWIQTAFEPLADMRVPCEPKDFLDRWANGDTVATIRRRAERERRLPPIALAEATNDTDEQALLRSLKLIGVVEERTNGKINMPDIFRVAAGIKRMGGVRPPPRRRNAT